MSGILNPDEGTLRRILCWFGKHDPRWMAGADPPYWRCHRCHKRFEGTWTTGPR